MSNLIDDANLAVRLLVQKVFGLPDNFMRPSDQRADAGSQSAAFGTVKIIHATEIGWASDTVTQNDDGKLTETVEQPLRIVASVQFFKSLPAPADLQGAPISKDVTTFHAVANGGFDVLIDGTNRKVTGLNFSGAPDMPGLAAILQAALNSADAGVTATWSGRRLIVTSSTTGQGSSVACAVAPTSSGPPTDVSTTLGLSAAAGASPSDGATGIATYSNEAFDRARRLPLLLRLSANVELMQTMGLGFERSSKARNLAGLTDATWESRGSVDLTFNIISREALAVAAVESVSIGLNVQQPDGVIQTRTIEVST